MSGVDLIAELLPPGVACTEVRGRELPEDLFPEELAAIADAAPGRRQSFATARACARRALGQLEVAPVAIPMGERGAPRWPAGIVGSITHCDGYRAAAVARAGEVLGLGIDAEPHNAIAGGVLARIALDEERALVEELSRADPQTAWGLLLFSAKESVFKACWPLLGQELGFKQMQIEFDAVLGTFAVKLLGATPRNVLPRAEEIAGRWLVRDGLVLTAAVLRTSRRREYLPRGAHP